MSLVYITGPTGSGKSTVCERLNDLGYETYDTDKGGIRHWLDEKTGEPIKEFTKGEVIDKFWMNQHKLGLPKKWLHDLKQKSSDNIIFICGTSPIDHSESGMYDKIILLNVDEYNQIERIKNRTNNHYGKEQRQLDNAVKWRNATIQRYRNLGAYEIDSSQPST